MSSSKVELPPNHDETLEAFAQLTPPSSTLKRRSENDNGTAEKRQRVDAGYTNGDVPEYNMAAIIAQATAAATQAMNENMGSLNEVDESDEQEVRAEQRTFISDPHLSMRLLSLPVLDSLSTQMLSMLAQGPYSETIKIVTEPESDFGQAYATLKKLFDETKKIYTRQASFLSADELDIQKPEHRATIRTTNLATFVASVFGGQDVGFYELNDHYIETFTLDNETLKEVSGELFLNLKTQMYLSAVSEEEQERTKEDILEDLFPLDLEHTLAKRHPGISLSHSELKFVVSSKARREHLMNQPSDVDSIQALSEKFAWEDFLRSLSDHLRQACEPLLGSYMKRHNLEAPEIPVHTSNHNEYRSYQDSSDANPCMSIEIDMNALAEQAAQEALQAYGQDQQQSTTQRSGETPEVQNGTNDSQYCNNNAPVPFPTQTQPTRVLYEKARQAAVAKSTPTNARRPGLPSQRRPWSTEEENALMAGLDAVKGPHWSQILMLYGAKGSVNEMLKDRNQVQLKDKARNLKLFFLKSGIEVPYYLQSVTGELKTRAPSQAARREQEERARLGGDDERARFDSILALSQGLSDPQNRHSSDEDAEDDASDTGDSSEQLQVIDLEHDGLPTSHPISEDEQFRQRLMDEADKAGTTTSAVA